MPIKIKGLPELVKKLGPDVYQAPIAAALEEAIEYMAGVARTRARGSIVGTIQADSKRLRAGNRLTTLPIGKVNTDSRHGIILNYGGRGKRSRWVDGGRRTKSWLSGIPRLKGVKAKVEAVMAQACRDLEALWQR